MEQPKKEFKSELERLRHFQEEAHAVSWRMYQASGSIAVALHILEQFTNDMSYEAGETPLNRLVPFVNVGTALFGVEEILRIWIRELDAEHTRLHELYLHTPEPKSRKRAAA